MKYIHLSIHPSTRVPFVHIIWMHDLKSLGANEFEVRLIVIERGEQNPSAYHNYHIEG